MAYIPLSNNIATVIVTNIMRERIKYKAETMPITRVHQTTILMYIPCGTKRERRVKGEERHQTLSLM